jgi:hypothetical protein
MFLFSEARFPGRIPAEMYQDLSINSSQDMHQVAFAISIFQIFEGYKTIYTHKQDHPRRRSPTAVLSITRNPVRNIHLSFSYGQILANLSFSNGQFQGDLRTCTGSKRSKRSSKRSSVMLCSRGPPPTSRDAMQGYECCNHYILCAV